VSGPHGGDGRLIPGETSTGSKRHDVLFGALEGPRRMVRSAGCRLWDDAGRTYVDFGMALGAVALGYAHPAVTGAAERAVRDGVVGTLPPVAEDALAERLVNWVPGGEAVRFLKTGAEAVAAAVRLARDATGRETILTCGYHGWLDWCGDAAGIPERVRALRRVLAFNDAVDLGAALRDAPDPAAIVVEPVVEAAPDPAWLRAVRDAASGAGAVLIFDEIKTGIRFGPGGAAGRYGVSPDLVVLGKALGNGFPIAAVVGPRSLMEAASRTWISSTLATESVALAAALAVLEIFETTHAAAALAERGERFVTQCRRIAAAHPETLRGVGGIPEFSFLRFASDAVSAQVAAAAARHGVLLRRTPYNFVSVAHDDATIAEAAERIEQAVAEVGMPC
jgi:glutamate-1-semialdehyde 2,1-aminomutase